MKTVYKIVNCTLSIESIGGSCMPVKKIVDGVKKLNDVENLKSGLDMKSHIKEIQRMGFKRFWKMNNKVFYLSGIILLGLIGIHALLNSEPVRLIKTDLTWSKFYFIITAGLFTMLAVYIIKFTLTVSIKQEFNTDNFMRAKMGKLKGIDWKSAEEPFQKKKNS